MRSVGMSTVFIALGSNLGDRAANLRAALEAFEPDVHILAESGIYETPPWGYSDQPAFLNMVVKAGTRLAPQPLLDFLKGLESRLGRQESFRYGPRSIDLDILFYDDLVLDEPQLSIPHPRLHERGFVLVPLAELAADLRHPVLQKSIAELLAEADASEIRRFNI
jgi:2-amino-4-hydroxy-6-hydroxymethyldihydropteridine diphosphokinase